MMKKWMGLLGLLSPIWLWAQAPGDCKEGIVVCDSVFTLSTLPNPLQNNVPNEINTSISCIQEGEQRGVWLRFRMQSTGNLGFVITPQDSTYDLDWQLFNLTDYTCITLWSFPEASLACNYSGVNGTNGQTGANGTNAQGFTPFISVDSAQSLALFVSAARLNATDSLGFTIDFTGSDVDLLPCNFVGGAQYTPQLPVYPNPTERYFQLPASVSVQNVGIFSMSGQMIHSFTSQAAMYDVSYLNAGIYIVHVLDKQGITHVFRLIKS